LAGAALITGAAGFIAHHLSDAVRRHGERQLVGVDVRTPPAGAYDQYHRIDLTDPKETRALISEVRPAVVYHLVGLIRGPDPDLRETNLGTARNLLDALATVAPDARVVLLGSAAEYGPVSLSHQPIRESHVGTPTWPYGRVKQELSALARHAARQGRQVLVARPFNIIGPRVPDTLVAGAIIQRLIQALRGSPPYRIAVGRTSAVRDFIAVEDVAAGLMRLAEQGVPGEAYNVCSGVGHTVQQVIDCLVAETGKVVEVESDESLLRAVDADVAIGSPEKIMALGWAPAIPFDDSLRASWRAALQAASA
jgi:GDP-4-dehydro-6-deoxy-D-mannose reductase